MIIFNVHSFIQRTYIAPLQDNLLRGAPSPTTAIENSFQILVKVYAESPARRTRRSEGRLFQMVGPTTEKARSCVFEVRAKGTARSPRDAERRFLRVAKPEVGRQNSRK